MTRKQETKISSRELHETRLVPEVEVRRSSISSLTHSSAGMPLFSSLLLDLPTQPETGHLLPPRVIFPICDPIPFASTAPVPCRHPVVPSCFHSTYVYVRTLLYRFFVVAKGCFLLRWAGRVESLWYLDSALINAPLTCREGGQVK